MTASLHPTQRRRSNPGALPATIAWMMFGLILGGRAASAPAVFMGHACSDDRCGSHKAGFDWAERNGIVDPRACLSRNDPTFAEGCRAFVKETVTAEQAGFQWARENDLGDARYCAGAGPRFEAGCQAYVRAVAD
jgi:hypothetical protein